MSESKYTERQPFKTQKANWSFDMALQKWPTVINNQKKYNSKFAPRHTHSKFAPRHTDSVMIKVKPRYKFYTASKNVTSKCLSVRFLSYRDSLVKRARFIVPLCKKKVMTDICYYDN